MEYKLSKLLLFTNLIMNIIIIGFFINLYFGNGLQNILTKNSLDTNNNSLSIVDTEVIMTTTDKELFEKALVTFDKTKCDEIENIVVKTDCQTKVKYNLISSLVISENNISHCEKLEKFDLITNCKNNYLKYMETQN